MNNNERLLDLISKREEMCSKPIKHEMLYQWLEELHYLLGQVNFSSSIILRTRTDIEKIFYSSNSKVMLEEKIIFIKAKLTVFEKYESEKLRKSKKMKKFL